MNELTTLRPPAVALSSNPLLSLKPSDMQRVLPGGTVFSHKPAVRGHLRCYLNGESLYPITERQIRHHARLVKQGRTEDARVYMKRAVADARVWKRTVLRDGDVLVWHEVTQERTVLQILTVVAALVYGFYTQDWATAFKFASYAFVAINILVPPTVPGQQPQEAPGSIFNASLNGNAAKLDQPIWKSFGLTKVTPPFASQPYYEYRDTDGDNLDNDQYYHAVFAVGVGNHDLLGAFIGKTPLGHYQDIIVATYLPPGTLPSQAKCNVVTSGEVTQLELESGRFVGGYAATQPKRRAKNIGIDVMCPQGLGKTGTLTVTWQVYYREIDDYGRPVTPWVVIGPEETRTANTNTPQRWTSTYELITAARVEIQIARTDVKDTDASARHALQWIGLRAYLDEPATLNAETAHYEVVMRASEQLSASSQRDFSLIVQALTRTWHPDTGWGAEAATRNPAWALADLWSSDVWGEGLPDERIDLQGLYDFSLECAERQDRFDHTFNTAMNAWDAAQTIARAGRARCFRRFGVNTLMRDKLIALPTTAYTARNTTPGSMAMTVKLPGRDAADGYVIEYISNVTWDTETIECPCPGYSVTDPDDPRFKPLAPAMSRPVYMKLEGIKGAKHAEREGLYEASVLLYRDRIVKCKTEMQGVIAAYGDTVRWMPEIAGYGQTGDVVAWDEATMTMTLSEPPLFTGVPEEPGPGGVSVTPATLLRLIRDDGSLTTAVAVTAGAGSRDVVLPEAPDFEIIVDNGMRERPKFLLGQGANADELVKVTAIRDGGKSDAEDGMDGAQLYDIEAVVDDDRVHNADRHLLPGPGEDQDVVYLPDDTTGGGLLYIVQLSDQLVYVNGVTLEASSLYQLTNYGSARTETVAPNSAAEILREWMRFGGISAPEAEMYEVRFTHTGGIGGGVFGRFGPPFYELVPPTGGDALDTWLSMGSTRGVSLAWVPDGPDYVGAISAVRVEIRDVDSGVVQDTALITLQVSFEPPDSTGG